MNDNILDYEGLQKDWGEMTDQIIQHFESECFDQRMEELIQGMLNKDWINAMLSSRILKESSTYYQSNNRYIKSRPFTKTVEAFELFVKEYCLRIEYPQNQPAKGFGPIYSIKKDFDDDARLQAYELFHPIIEQAYLLKIQMSKYTKSEFPADIFLKEGEQIKKLHEELKEKLKIAESTTQMRNIQRTSQTNYHTREQQNKQAARNTLVLDAVQVLDPPQNNQCSDKYMIFLILIYDIWLISFLI